MNGRQAYALANVVTDPDVIPNDVGLQRVEQLRDGNLLLSILAIDR